MGLDISATVWWPLLAVPGLQSNALPACNLDQPATSAGPSAHLPAVRTIPASLQFSATGQLPGASPELLAPLPCVWLLLPGAGRQPQPASAMLLSVRLPPRGLNDDAQMLLLGAGMGLESATRLVVYCPQTGQLLQWREWVQQDEHALYLHPRYRVPTWDSR